MLDIASILHDSQSVPKRKCLSENRRLISTCFFLILVIKPTRCTNFSNLFLEQNSTCFGQYLCPPSAVQQCTHSISICHTDYTDCLLASGQAVSITCMTYAYCCVYSARLLMMDRDTVRNMQSFIPKINLRNQCISFFYYKNISRCTVT